MAAGTVIGQVKIVVIMVLSAVMLGEAGGPLATLPCCPPLIGCDPCAPVQQCRMMPCGCCHAGEAKAFNLRMTVGSVIAMVRSASSQQGGRVLPGQKRKPGCRASLLHRAAAAAVGCAVDGCLALGSRLPLCSNMLLHVWLGTVPALCVQVGFSMYTHCRILAITAKPKTVDVAALTGLKSSGSSGTLNLKAAAQLPPARVVDPERQPLLAAEADGAAAAARAPALAAAAAPLAAARAGSSASIASGTAQQPQQAEEA